jgi:hypothetical protein
MTQAWSLGGTLSDFAMAIKPVTMRLLIERFLGDNHQRGRKICAETLVELVSRKNGKSECRLKLSEHREGLSVETEPHITREILPRAINADAIRIRMQPGAVDVQARQAAREAGLNAIEDGSGKRLELAME